MYRPGMGSKARQSHRELSDGKGEKKATPMTAREKKVDGPPCKTRLFIGARHRALGCFVFWSPLQRSPYVRTRECPYPHQSIPWPTVLRLDDGPLPTYVIPVA